MKGYEDCTQHSDDSFPHRLGFIQLVFFLLLFLHTVVAIVFPYRKAKVLNQRDWLNTERSRLVHDKCENNENTREDYMECVCKPVDEKRDENG